MTEKLSAQRNRYPLEHLPAGVHICWQVDGDEDFHASLAGIAQAVASAGAAFLYIVDRRPLTALRRQLHAIAPEVTAQGKAFLLEPPQILLDNARFDEQTALAQLRRFTLSHRAGGLPAPWIVVEMSWATWGLPGSDRWQAFESLLDSAGQELYGMFLCQYDRRHCPPDMLAEALRFHPYILFNGWVVPNQVYPGPIPSPILEREAVMVQMGLDGDSYQEYLRVFLEEAEGHAARLSEAVQAGSAKQVDYHAHSLKGAAATIGAVRVRDAAWELEQMGKRGSLAGAPQALEKLLQEIESVRRITAR
jgi:HPt (histidine-containing phosphotransfer) domain-containing protein